MFQSSLTRVEEGARCGIVPVAGLQATQRPAGRQDCEINQGSRALASVQQAGLGRQKSQRCFDGKARSGSMCLMCSGLCFDK